MVSAEAAASGEERKGEALRLALIAALSLVTYAMVWPAATGDMRHFVVPWLDTILERGGVHAFSAPFSNYTPPYLYLLALVSPLTSILPKISVIKLLSVGGTICLVMAVRRLLRIAGNDRPSEAAAWLFLVPSIAINAAGWGQCDAFWSAACVMAVAAAIGGRLVPMLLWFGVAIAFKAQALFLAPFIAQQLIVRRASVWFWPIPVFVYAAAMVPAALAGWPLMDLFTVYLRQAAWNPDFIGNAANPWSVVQIAAASGAASWTWVGDLAAPAAAGVYVLAYRRTEGNPHVTITLALLSAVLVPFLLPKMHERFFFLADVLAFVLMAARRDRRSLLLFLLVEGSSVAAIAGLMLNVPLAPAIGCAMSGAVILLLASGLRTSVSSDRNRTAPPTVRGAEGPAPFARDSGARRPDRHDSVHPQPGQRSASKSRAFAP
jgi:Gpi18-like mannosyltransferase